MTNKRKRYGRLTFIENISREGTVYKDRYRCDCGNEVITRRSDLQSGKTASCGCARRENAARVGAATSTHGHSKHPMYHLWRQMIHRCHNPKMAQYRYYGALGVTVCDKWRDDFQAFLDDVGMKPVGLELDRIDPTGDYEPGNVRWVNSRTNKLNNRKRWAKLHNQPI